MVDPRRCLIRPKSVLVFLFSLSLFSDFLFFFSLSNADTSVSFPLFFAVVTIFSRKILSLSFLCTIHAAVVEIWSCG